MTAPGPNTRSHASGLLDTSARGIGWAELVSGGSDALLMKGPAGTKVPPIRREVRHAWSTCRRRQLGQCPTALRGTAADPRCDGRINDNSLRQPPDTGAYPYSSVFE